MPSVKKSNGLWNLANIAEGYHRCRRRCCRNVVMDGRGYGPRRGVVSRCGRCDCRRTVKMERLKREDILRAVVLALAGRPTSRPSCFGRNAPAAAAAAVLSPSLSLLLSLSLQLRVRLMHPCVVAPLQLPCAADAVYSLGCFTPSCDRSLTLNSQVT